MPRLPTLVIRKASAGSPLLVPLIRTCRDIGVARNELRWLTEHVDRVVGNRSNQRTKYGLLKKLCKERGRSKPLQYLLGTEYFGDLELACRPGVLIPRPETAEIVTKLAEQMKLCIEAGQTPRHLQILDLCTGSGCMSLLFHSLTQKFATPPDFKTAILGIDVSSRAIQLAELNRRRLGIDSGLVGPPHGRSHVSFLRANILSQAEEPKPSSFLATDKSIGRKVPAPPFSGLLKEGNVRRKYDIVIANPPYIAPTTFMTTEVEKSVRLFEPRDALVPPASAAESDDPQTCLDSNSDLFYANILGIARQVEAKVVLMEVGGLDQALRVRNEVHRTGCWQGAAIWHDGIERDGFDNGSNGQARAVVCWDAQGANWLTRFDEGVDTPQRSTKANVYTRVDGNRHGEKEGSQGQPNTR